MSEKTKIGFVGCGGIAESHLTGLAKHPDVSLVAFCDINLSRAKEVAEKYGSGAPLCRQDAKTFGDAKVMFDSVELDGAYFCLPPFAHGSEFLAVEHGVPFLVEKPINLYLNQAKEIAAAVAEKHLLTSTGYMNRYRKSIQTVRELLVDDPAILVLGGWIGGTPRPGPSGGGIWSWWVVKDKSGGQFHEQVTHTVDIVRFLCGDVVGVHAFAAKGLNKGAPENYTIEDASVVNLHFANGAVANLWASCSANADGGGVSLNVYANQTTALFTGWEHSLQLLRAGQEKPEVIKGEPDIFAIEDDAFIQAIRQNDPSRVQSSYADGLKTLEVTLAANESMETGKPIEIAVS